MFTCTQHDGAILHEDFHCPLCAECEDHNDTHKGIDAAEDMINALQAVAEETASADTLQLIAENEVLKDRLESASRCLESVERDMYDLRSRTWTKTRILARCLIVEQTIYKWRTK